MSDSIKNQNILVPKSEVPVSQLAVLDLVEPTADRRIPGVTYFQSDITDKSATVRVVTTFQPGVIIHTASSPYHIADLDVFMRSNVGRTENLMDASVVEASVKAFVYNSSSSVVHDCFSNLVEADETWPLLFMPKQRQPCHHSKAMAERLALGYNRKRPGFTVTAIRPSGLFGPDDRSTIQSLVERSKAGGLRMQIGDGTDLADFTYADNTVHGHILAAEALLIAVRLGEEAVAEHMLVERGGFTITNDEHPKFWDLARQVGASAGYPNDPQRILISPNVSDDDDCWSPGLVEMADLV